MAAEMAMDDRASRLDMKHGFVKQIIRNQVSRDEYDKDIKVTNSKQNQKKKTKPGATRESQAYYLPPRLRKQSGEASVKKEGEQEETKEETTEEDVKKEDVKKEDENDFVEEKLFKLEYVDQHGQVHNRVVYMGENAEDIARELAIKTNLSEELRARLEVKILNNITAKLDRN